MRRVTVLFVLFALIAVAVAGCGDNGGGGEADSSLDEALGYLSEDAPLVIAIDTDVEGDQFQALEAIAKKFPFGGQLRDELLNELDLGGGDFEKDVKPILGNEFVVGATDVRSIVDESEDDDFVAAIQAEDGGALEDAVEKEGAEEQGDQSGATVYEDSDGDSFAIKDDVLVVAGSKQLLDGALKRREGDDRLTEDTFEQGLEGLPDDALIKAYGDVGALIENDPETQEARKVEWVGAVDTFGLTASVQEDEVAVEFNLTTEGDLSDEDLPLASGEDSPGIAQRKGEIGVGLRGLNQVAEFAQAAGQAVDPTGFGEFETAKRQIEKEFGVSIDDDVLGQLGGDTSVAFDIGGSFAARAELDDPERFRNTLEKAAPILPSFFEGTNLGPLQQPRGGDGLYRLPQEGGTTYAFGVVGDVFVVTDDPGRAEEIAQAEPEAVEGAEGALAFRVDAQALVDSFLSQLGGLEAIGGRLFTGPLGNLTGSVESSTDGLRGSLTLEID